MVVGVPRSSHRYQARELEEEQLLIQRMTELALQYGQDVQLKISAKPMQ